MLPVKAHPSSEPHPLFSRRAGGRRGSFGRGSTPGYGPEIGLGAAELRESRAFTRDEDAKPFVDEGRRLLDARETSGVLQQRVVQIERDPHGTSLRVGITYLV